MLILLFCAGIPYSKVYLVQDSTSLPAGRRGRRTRRSHARTAVFVLIVFFVRLLRGCSKVYSQHSPCVRDWSGYPFCLHHCIFHPPVSFVDHLLRQGGLRKKRYERKARPSPLRHRLPHIPYAAAVFPLQGEMIRTFFTEEGNAQNI